jgi:hypothetical protein
MATPHEALFDSDNPGHKTIPEWRAAGPLPHWWTNIVAYAILHGEARALTRMGSVLRLTYQSDGPLEVEEL